MKYKMMVDESFTDKLDETIKYKPGDIVKTKVDEKRKEDLIARKLAHVVEEKSKEKGAKNKASKTPTDEK